MPELRLWLLAEVIGVWKGVGVAIGIKLLLSTSNDVPTDVGNGMRDVSHTISEIELVIPREAGSVVAGSKMADGKWLSKSEVVGGSCSCTS